MFIGWPLDTIQYSRILLLNKNIVTDINNILQCTQNLRLLYNIHNVYYIYKINNIILNMNHI